MLIQDDYSIRELLDLPKFEGEILEIYTILLIGIEGGGNKCDSRLRPINVLDLQDTVKILRQGQEEF
jgi:hypothetical protein